MLIRIAAIVFLSSCLARAGAPSELWGEHGERWSPTSPLPDFRYAGYHSGRDPIPDVKAVADVKKFGAKGDGTTDDTEAFLAAVKAASNTADNGGGAIEIPRGRYVITQIIHVPSRVVLRGAGIGTTTLLIPKSLEELAGAKKVEDEMSGYSFSGGFVTIAGKPKSTRVAPLAANAKRGDRRLVLTSAGAGKLKVGDWIRVVSNNDKSLGRHLHNDRFDAGAGTFAHKNFINWVARVEAIQKDTITLDRPLRTDLRKPWQPEVWTYQSGVEEVGVENLSFQFAGRAKRPHLKEEGFNAVYFDGADNCWVRNCSFLDADNGVNVTRARFVTVADVTFRESKRKSPSGHHALWARQAQDCLFTNFSFETQYVHDLSVEGFSCGNVFEKGRGGAGAAINFDHHANAPYENLFTDIDVGDVRRLWSSGGSAPRRPHTGARSTVWGVTYSKGNPPKLPDWPQLIVVGVKGYSSGPADAIVDEAGGDVTPRNLFRAQTSLRPAAATTAARGGG